MLRCVTGLCFAPDQDPSQVCWACYFASFSSKVADGFSLHVQRPDQLASSTNQNCRGLIAEERASSHPVSPPPAVPGCMHIWGRDMRFEDMRKASNRGVQDYIYTPHSSALKTNHPNYRENLKLVQERFDAKEPLIVRGCKGRMSWMPDVSEGAGQDLCFDQTSLGCMKTERARLLLHTTTCVWL